MLNALVTSLSEFIGTPEPALRLLLSLLLGYPIALIHRKHLYNQDPTSQHLYFIITGFSLGYFNYGFDICHALIAVVFTFLTLTFLGGRALCVGTVFIFNMGYLLIGYHYSGTNDYDINWTVPQCVLVLRLIAVSYDLYDGRQPLDKLSGDAKKTALAIRPRFLEFCGHQMFPTSFLIGPQFSMRRYQDFITGKFGDQEKPNEPPNSTSYALRRFSLGIFYVIVFQVLGMFIDDAYIISDEYGELNIFKRLIWLGVWGRYTLYKYISCWLLAEGGGILFGISYNGVDEKGTVKWNGLENVKLTILENSTEFNHYIQSFNVNTNQWVLQYVYKRLKFLNNRYISQAVSLLFLAIWHGFHSGYYVCFLFEFLVIYLEKDLQSILKRNENLKGWLKNTPPVALIINVILRLYTFVFMGWCLIPFALLKFDRYWKAYSNVNYAGIYLYVLWPFVYGPLLRVLIVKKRVSQSDVGEGISYRSEGTTITASTVGEHVTEGLKEHRE